MNRIAISAIAVAVCSFAGAASAAPLGPSAGISTRSSVENVRVVCQERRVWRTDKWGNPKRVTIRDCDRVGGGPRYYDGRYDGPRYVEPGYGGGYGGGGGRYYHEGNYYSDPGFTIRIR
ncbi:hypothetical protein G3545_19365 [Starkeya sp. ORNL1]|uniref:hypothetical protein n=1 Tax=Starkeya sp. ORNL1 TaxID=2709380 RepID=UPI001463EC7F|nr:hypothetical protein [Starkeya sp. ORNL1]QJP15627.1 hypothetical protein G3545_19365 [Starkeya sp. ORNL1]